MNAITGLAQVNSEEAIDNQAGNWERSYQNHDNFIFYPHEEIIRFVSKFIRKRTDIDCYQDIAFTNSGERLLDIGCGIGQHVLYALNAGFDAYGSDLSTEAVKKARSWLEKEGYQDTELRLQQADVRNLPWPDQNFHYAISRGVLDSMHYEIAKAGVKEIHRVLKPGAFFYCDLISGDDSAHHREFAGEEVVKTIHEQDTMQSYFNFAKICDLVGGLFKILECNLITKEDVLSGVRTARYHLALERI